MAHAADSSCPLYLHKASGNWCKTIKGRRHYFGKNKASAVEKWYRQKDDLLAGKKPRNESDIVTVGYAANYMLTRKKRLLEAGELSIRSYSDMVRLCKYACDQLGKNRSIESLDADDFGELRRKMVRRWPAPSGLVARINTIRQIFNFAYKNALIDRPVRFGDQFSPPTKRVRRKARHARGEKMFEAHEIRQLIDAAPTPHLKAFILLAANTGIGNSDISRMEHQHLDLERGWMNYPRGKTGVPRRAKLWEETVAAIKEATATQKPSRNYGHLVFRTRHRQPWSNPNTSACALSRAFIEHAKNIGVHGPGKGIYTLRHVVETIGGECRDQVAVDTVLGHDSGSIASEYRERVSDERLERVADTVHAWLFAVGRPPR